MPEPWEEYVWHCAVVSANGKHFLTVQQRGIDTDKNMAWVDVWKVEPLERVARARVPYHVGYPAGTISPNAVYFAGYAYTCGAAFHRTSDSARLWDLRRKGIAATPCFLTDELVLLKERNNRFIVVRAEDKSFVRDFPSAADYFLNPYGDVHVAQTLDERSLFCVDSQGNRLDRPMFDGSSVLYTEFAHDQAAFFVSRMGGPVECFELAAGGKVWSHRWPKDAHAIELRYVPGDPSSLICTLFHCGGETGRFEVVCLEVKSGDVLALYDSTPLDMPIGLVADPPYCIGLRGKILRRGASDLELVAKVNEEADGSYEIIKAR